ncbi:hypothetical protein HK098_001656 [Nowakowskiella sp. JEL0407]|nr:hypothetical protein HK098_001656 [Nowakowskiella sp. JEL0407]
MDKRTADHLIRSINAMGDVINATQTNLNAASRQFSGTSSDGSSDIPDDQGLEIFGDVSSIQQFFRGFYEAQSRQTSAHNTSSYFLESQTIPALKMIKTEITNKLKEASEEWAALDEELRADQKKFIQLTGALATLMRWQRDLALKMRRGEIKLDDESNIKKDELSETESKASSSVTKTNEGGNGNAGFISFVSGYFTPPANNANKNTSKDDEITMHDILTNTPPQSPVNGTSSTIAASEIGTVEKEVKNTTFLPPFPVNAPGAANNVGPGDPWLYNMVIKHHIARCVAKQRATRAQLLDQQQTMAVFEQTIISLVQNAVIGFLEFRQRQLNTELNVSTIPLFKQIQSVRGPDEWALFRKEHTDLLIDESAPFVEAKHMVYKGMDHPLAEIVREGPLDRLHKIATFRKPEWKEEYYVLTASGYLHGFPHHPIIAVNVTAGAFVGAAAIEHEKSIAEPAQLEVKESEDILATTARSFASNFNLRRKSTKKRGTMFYDSKTAKFKPQASVQSVIEEEPSSDFSVVGTDEVKDVTAELVKEQVNSLMNQLSDGALDRGEPIICLYLPDCEISPLGIPLDGKPIPGFGPLEFEIVSKPKGRVFPRFNEKYRFKAYSQDQADFWWELISTMTKRNGSEGLEAVVNSTARASQLRLLTPQTSPKSINSGQRESYIESPVTNTIRKRRPSFPNGIVAPPDSPQSPKFTTNNESFGAPSTTSIYNWASATIKETESPKSIQSHESTMSKFGSMGRRSSSTSKRSGGFVSGSFNVLEQASPSPTTPNDRDTPSSELDKIPERTDDESDTDKDDSDQDFIQYRRKSMRYIHGTTPPPKQASKLQTGWSPRERRNSNASNASTVSAEPLYDPPSATEPLSINTRDDFDTSTRDFSNSPNSYKFTTYSSPSPNLPSTPTISTLKHLAPTPPSTPLTLQSANNSVTNLNASLNTGNGSVDLMQAVLKAQASRAITDTPTMTNPSTPIGTPSFSHFPDESYFKPQTQTTSGPNSGTQSPSLSTTIPSLTISSDKSSEEISPEHSLKPKYSGNLSTGGDVLAAVAEKLQTKPGDGNNSSSVSWGGVYDPSSDQSDDEDDVLNAFKAKFAPPQVVNVSPSPVEVEKPDEFNAGNVENLQVGDVDSDSGSDSFVMPQQPVQENNFDLLLESLDSSLASIKPSGSSSPVVGESGERKKEKESKTKDKNPKDKDKEGKEKKKESKEKKEKKEKRDSALETPEERERREKKRREKKERTATIGADERERKKRDEKKKDEKKEDKKKDEKKEEKRRDKKLSMAVEDREKRKLKASSRFPEARKAP